MTKVIMYKANDGSLHATSKEKDARNLQLRTEPAAEAFAASIYNDGAGPAVLGVREDLAEFIVTHADALRKLLNDALVVRRPRKARADKGTKAAAKVTSPEASTFA